MELPDNLEEIEKRALLIGYLIHSFVSDSISKEGHNELDNWVCASMKNQRLFENMIDPDFIKKYKGYSQIVSAFLEPEGSPLAFGLN